MVALISARHETHRSRLSSPRSLAAAGARAEPAPAAPAAPAARPAHWAEPITLEGVPNLHRITPMLYRSEQPTALGMKNLEKLGIRTVINLRSFNDDDDEVQGTTCAPSARRSSPGASTTNTSSK